MRSLTLCVATVALLAAGCASVGIGPGQREDIVRWEAETARLGHPEVKFVEHYDPDKAFARGFLPGGGFYVNPGLGVSSLVWPFSMAWVPATARPLAERYNYLAFRSRVFALRRTAAANVSAGPESLEVMRERRRLETQWNGGRISELEYLERRDRLDRASNDAGSEPPER
jgi:hypothetical protein